MADRQNARNAQVGGGGIGIGLGARGLVGGAISAEVGLFGIGDREIGAGDDVGTGRGDGGESFAHPFVVADPHGDAVAGTIAALDRAIVAPVDREVSGLSRPRRYVGLCATG